MGGTPLQTACEALGLPWSQDWEAPVKHHLALLRRWAPRVNLVSMGTLNDALNRHVVDSFALMALPAVRDAAGPAADVGSGAGFPGIPMAAARPELDWTLIEPRKKRGAFITQVLTTAGMKHARWYDGRIPDASLNGRFGLVVSRATLAPDDLLKDAQALLAPGGILAVMAAHPPDVTTGLTPVGHVELTIGDAPRWIGAWRRDATLD